jgi:hypothetical protein
MKYCSTSNIGDPEWKRSRLLEKKWPFFEGSLVYRTPKSAVQVVFPRAEKFEPPNLRSPNSCTEETDDYEFIRST